MISEKLPRKMRVMRNEKPYLNCFEMLTNCMDGNSILLFFNKTEEFLQKYSVIDKGRVVQSIIRLINEFGYTLHKLERYVGEQLEKYDDTFFDTSTADSIVYLLLKYNTAAKKAGLATSIIRYPFSLGKALCFVNEEIIKQENRVLAFNEQVTKLSKYNFMEDFRGKHYYSMVPQNEMELINEGYQMHNCLVVRGDAFAADQMRIIFIRKDKDKPYIDVIMNNRDKIVWAITNDHKNIEGEDLDLVYHWYTNHVVKVNSPAEMY